MFRSRRLRRAHARFLESCRNLKEGRDYWGRAAGFLQVFLPVPLLGLHEDGRAVLAALEWLEANCRERPLTSEVLRHYHRLLGLGGDYRRHDLRMGPDNPLRPPPASRIPALMTELDGRLARDAERLGAARDADALFRAAVETHHRIGVLHPFSDGNGRVARLAMNHLLRRFDQGYVIYPPLTESEPLWTALQEAGRGDFEPLAAFARTCVRPI